ncbi:carbohydrate ABC transporter permease [Demequina sp. SYSU T00039]|uniref:Carbohydrate ABC transporter permease n=1 Tax=Demequina lignilytica TaxID=3051663 RepID=A0AAW7M8G5_9MICO|nr:MULTISPECIES: carbohydrate ABC transporter permease [unclassified Demequina]MDN4477921.1 carbohydrate ABC transporter permease [Demequina sp. SYSU T00039-1]MDN4487830.1 carbohydrate ABC transporter permease [Demequina sp. SYSU T00039]MDN4490787.1 carbohydrate ABC transporter permease [Demequina sp. SYSU T00068]
MFRYTKLTLVREIGVVLAALVMLSPFYILIATALKPRQALLTTPAISWPETPTFDAFREVMGEAGSSGVWQGLMNSLIITVGAVAGLVAIGSITAYVLARKLSKVSNVVYALVIAGIVVPPQLGLIPIYTSARSLGLIGSQWGMIVLYIGMIMPLSIFLYAGFVRAIPREYEEAATIDGASKFKVFTRVIFPLLAPATGTVAIMTGLVIWNDFFNALIFLQGTDAATLPVFMYGFVGSLTSRWDLIFAVVIISMIPILTFYLFAQKKFIQGFAGGIKS